LQQISGLINLQLKKKLSWHLDYPSMFSSHATAHGPVAKLLSKTLQIGKINLSRKISACSHLKVYTGPFPLGMTYLAKHNAQVT